MTSLVCQELDPSTHTVYSESSARAYSLSDPPGPGPGPWPWGKFASIHTHARATKWAHFREKDHMAVSSVCEGCSLFRLAYGERLAHCVKL